MTEKEQQYRHPTMKITIFGDSITNGFGMHPRNKILKERIEEKRPTLTSNFMASTEMTHTAHSIASSTLQPKMLT